MQFGDARLPGTFWSRVVPEPNSGCWLWTGAVFVTGYGKLVVNARYWLAHRLAYEAANGPHAPGLELDHLCRTKLCINPVHLEPVTHLENVRRGTAWTWRKERTHCPNGHPFDMFFDGFRRCSVCNTAAKNKYKAKMKARRSDERSV